MSLNRLMLSILAVILLIEEWLWDVLTALGRCLAGWLGLTHFEAWLFKASPRVAMAALILPVTLVLPIKLAAFWLFAHGQFAQGLALLIGAKLFATLLISRMFAICRTQLLTFSWFAAVYFTLTRWLSWAHRRIRNTYVYRQASKIKRLIKQKRDDWFPG